MLRPPIMAGSVGQAPTHSRNVAKTETLTTDGRDRPALSYLAFVAYVFRAVAAGSVDSDGPVSRRPHRPGPGRAATQARIWLAS